MIRRFFAFLFIGLPSLLLCAASVLAGTVFPRRNMHEPIPWRHIPKPLPRDLSSIAKTVPNVIVRMPWETAVKSPRCAAITSGRQPMATSSGFSPGRSGSRHAVVVQPAGSPAVATRSLSAFDPVSSINIWRPSSNACAPGSRLRDLGERASGAGETKRLDRGAVLPVCRHPQNSF